MPSRRRHWMNTRLRTRLRAGGSRQHYQQFDSSTSETDDESSGAMLPILLQSSKQEHPLLPSEPARDTALSDTQSDISLLDCLPQLFSDHELAPSPSPQLSRSPSPSAKSLVGTSAPLLTDLSLTDYLNNYPIWPNRAEDSSLTQSLPASPSSDDEPTARSKPPNAPSFKRGRGRRRKKTRAPLSARSKTELRPQHQNL